jgi:hypothetical protein
VTVTGEHAAEAEAEAVTVPAVPRCSAIVPVSALLDSRPGVEFLGMVECGLPAAGRIIGRCPHGHVRDGWLCEPHAALAGEGGCRACRELEDGAHDCALTVERVTGGPS